MGCSRGALVKRSQFTFWLWFRLVAPSGTRHESAATIFGQTIGACCSDGVLQTNEADVSVTENDAWSIRSNLLSLSFSLYLPVSVCPVRARSACSPQIHSHWTREKRLWFETIALGYITLFLSVCHPWCWPVCLDNRKNWNLCRARETHRSQNLTAPTEAFSGATIVWEWSGLARIMADIHVYFMMFRLFATVILVGVGGGHRQQSAWPAAICLLSDNDCDAPWFNMPSAIIVRCGSMNFSFWWIGVHILPAWKFSDSDVCMNVERGLHAKWLFYICS